MQIRKGDYTERIVKFPFDNIGRAFSAVSISKYQKSENGSIDNETVYSYLNKLVSIFILHCCTCYNIVEKLALRMKI